MSHCNTMGTLLCSCAKVCELIELLLVVSGVGPGIDVLDGVHVPQKEEEVWGICQSSSSPLVSMADIFNRNVFDSCVKS